MPSEWPDPSTPPVWDWSGPDDPPATVFILRFNGDVEVLPAEVLPAEEYFPAE